MTFMPTPSRGNSREAAFIACGQDRLRSGQRPPNAVASFAAANPVEEKLFAALARMKVLTSQVAMHLDRTWRDRLFAQLDRLHDPEQWDDGDDPVDIASFQTFLGMMYILKPDRPPGLGLANEGHLLASWIDGRNRLTIECLPNDKVRLVLTRWIGEERDSDAILTGIDRVRLRLASYEPTCWFGTPRWRCPAKSFPIRTMWSATFPSPVRPATKTVT